MTFEAPWYALLILVLPVCVLFYELARRWRKAALDQFIGAGMKPETPASHLERPLGQLPSLWTLAGVIPCFVLALMQPLWGQRAEETPRTGRDIVILLDTSLSMLAEDMRPNRIQHAKAIIRQFVDAVRADGGHRLALVAFAGRPSLQCPLTLDYDLFLERLTDTTVDTVPREGSMIGEAIHHALERLDGLRPGFADMILVSDGEDHGGLLMEGAAAAAASDIDIYTLGIGDPENGAPIPVVDADGERSLLEYDGFEVRSKVRSDLLADMAQLTKGRYLGANAEIGALNGLYKRTLSEKPRRQLDVEPTDLPAHRFQWFVLLALLLLVFDQLWVGRKARAA